MSNVPFVANPAGAATDAPSGAFPIDLYGAGSGGAPTAPAWGEITGKPATFPPVVGTTATTAKAGNYTPTSAEVSAGLKAKAQITALAAVSAANAAPAEGAEPTKAEYDVLVTLANANKATINAIISALKA